MDVGHCMLPSGSRAHSEARSHERQSEPVPAFPWPSLVCTAALSPVPCTGLETPRARDAAGDAAPRRGDHGAPGHLHVPAAGGGGQNQETQEGKMPQQDRIKVREGPAASAQHSHMPKGCVFYNLFPTLFELLTTSYIAWATSMWSGEGRGWCWGGIESLFLSQARSDRLGTPSLLVSRVTVFIVLGDFPLYSVASESQFV